MCFMITLSHHSLLTLSHPPLQPPTNACIFYVSNLPLPLPNPIYYASHPAKAISVCHTILAINHLRYRTPPPTHHFSVK